MRMAIDFLQHGIDDQRLASLPAREQIGVGSGYGIEQLAKDQGASPKPDDACHPTPSPLAGEGGA
jgi:hypothetical protein